MNDRTVTKTGKLLKDFLPAIYFDSSVLIDYWNTDGMEMPEDEFDKIIKEGCEYKYLQVVKNILRSEIRIDKVLEIRKKIIYRDVKVTPVVSPISLLELIEWHAEAVFKQIASQSSGTMFIQKKSKKEIGDYLKKATELYQLEIKERKNKKQSISTSTSLYLLMSDTMLNPSFATAHGLDGLLLVDIFNFNFPTNKVWIEELSFYAYLQLGVADIIHILLTKHLGCRYLASFDSDFKRVKEIVEEEKGILILTSPEEILEVL